MTAKDLVDFLETGGIGTYETDLFYSFLPPEPAALVCVLPSGGYPPDLYLPIADPTFQICIRAETYDDAEAQAAAVAALFRDALDRPKTNFTIGTTYVYLAQFLQEPTTAYIGYNTNGRAEFSCNLHLKIRI